MGRGRRYIEWLSLDVGPGAVWVDSMQRGRAARSFAQGRRWSRSVGTTRTLVSASGIQFAGVNGGWTVHGCEPTGAATGNGLDAHGRTAASGGGSAVGEVRETAVVQLVRDGDGTGGTVPVLGEDQVRLAGSGVVALERVGPVQQDDHVRVLLDRVVQDDSIGDEAVCPGHGGVEHFLIAEAPDLDDAVPEDVVAREHVQS